MQKKKKTLTHAAYSLLTDYESETAITAAGGISLGVGVASSMADLVFDVVHEIWNVQLNVRL